MKRSAYLLLFCFIFILSACRQTPPASFCGDSRCEFSENSESCPTDCTIPSPEAKTQEPVCKFPDFKPHSQGQPLKTTSINFNGADPFVLYDAEENIFKMWYTHYVSDSSHPRGGRLGFAYATSSDGITWTVRTDASGNTLHVLDPSADRTQWDWYGIETADVVKKDGKYYLWYYGYPGLAADGTLFPIREGRRDHLGFATSTDGIHWIKSSLNPALRPTLWFEAPFISSYVENGRTFSRSLGGIQEPAVVWDEKKQKFRMWYEGITSFKEKNGRTTAHFRIGYAESSDGATWTKNPEPVFQATKNPQAWDTGGGTGHPSVIADPQRGYHLAYAGGGVRFTVGHAWSKDGIIWERNPNNPVEPIIIPPANSGKTYYLWGGPSIAYNPKTQQMHLYMMRSSPVTAGNAGGAFSKTTFHLYTADC